MHITKCVLTKIQRNKHIDVGVLSSLTTFSFLLTLAQSYAAAHLVNLGEEHAKMAGFLLRLNVIGRSLRCQSAY